MARYEPPVAAGTIGAVTDRTPCEVLVDGRWVPGWLISWRRTDQGWRGLVEYTAGGLGYYQERPADELRPRE